jgi:hypothetical protein
MRPVPVVLLLLLALPGASRAQTGEAEPAPGEPAPAPERSQPLDLDRLLRPPSAIGVPKSASEPSYGGRDRIAWREQFSSAKAEVADLESKVEVNQQRLRENTAGDWNYTPAGGEASDPEVLKLRAQLRRDRQSLEAARQRLRDLRVEASLAGVPESWLEE